MICCNVMFSVNDLLLCMLGWFVVVCYIHLGMILLDMDDGH
jgi:hypothetical protein